MTLNNIEEEDRGGTRSENEEVFWVIGLAKLFLRSGECDIS